VPPRNLIKNSFTGLFIISVSGCFARCVTHRLIQSLTYKIMFVCSYIGATPNDRTTLHSALH